MRPMPLPRSLTCSSCQHTYPEGWKRCPYCGFDPEKQKRDRQIERALVKRFPSYAAAVNQGGGSKRKPQSRRERTPNKPPRQGDQVHEAATGQGDAAEAERKRSRRRRGRRRRSPGGEPTTPQDGVQTAQPRIPRERRQGSSDERTKAAPSPAPREPRAPQGQPEPGAGGAESQARRTRRRRPRRRRKPGGGGANGGGEPKSDS